MGSTIITSSTETANAFLNSDFGQRVSTLFWIIVLIGIGLLVWRYYLSVIKK